MKQRILVISLLTIVEAAAILPLAATGASAATSTTVWRLKGNAVGYNCVGPCSTTTYFWINGPMKGASTSFRISAVGALLKVEANGCLDQLEHYALTAMNGPDRGDNLYFKTTNDRACPTKNSNVALETSAFKITSGTGAWKSAAGNGTLKWMVKFHPQIGSGTVIVRVNL